MAAEAFELAARRRRTDKGADLSVETVWQVIGATGYDDAAVALSAVLPASITFPGSRTAFLTGVESVELLDDEYWEFRATYASQPRPDVDETEFEFDVSAQTERVYQSLATTGYAPAGKSVPNFGGAIGLANGVPQGAEPLTAFSTFNITKHWALASVSQSYQLTLEALIGSVSNATFYGRAAGTVRFLGARGRRSGDRFPISYSFGFRPNVSAFAVDAVTVTSANGWDIIDPYYEAQADATAKKLVRRARAVYVHRIHPLVSFSGLGL